MAKDISEEEKLEIKNMIDRMKQTDSSLQN